MANESKNDGIGKTLLVVLLLCLVCSVVVAGSAVGLKPKQQEQKLLDKQRNILDVAGLLQPKMEGDQVKSLFSQRIEPRLLDLNSGEFAAGKAAFDLAAALRDDGKSAALAASDDPAGIKRRSNQAEIYLVRDEGGAVSKIVLPVYGTGLWSMMYAFVALDSDGNTVKGITYYDQGETPGLGGEVENAGWRQQWVGKKLFDANGQPAIRVVKGGARPGDEHGVDGLSGATLTSNGVQHTFDFWLGEHGFGPFLKKVREGALKNG
ncbi:Na(+)-translocating NADH-quinone reductase subunit C [Serratia entomophila]|uniref:Na(+)-translocating NADH-quinone reductase subunit C n=1 Tax=Serratia entomophila TaxID=42906 RepID=UPI00217B4142|nr:Na(+)-translocating NADH-quinone reductase subunit C [Serratia entomophila]CAI0953603.1 Na(+)-translocating NADH-quinone reductase subunit C [Serratia entomophila]CAI0956790.1 Na(+)-translocating NADH-quinone reductase subunit C [Serratia entomophila]CAI1640554.1 Na(+)-translocating NADH-quinone reductase subunit C [Serratia entomophila]CAI1779470.1 Na(+)-translocating NADH-quinone reductase subunit C [Serratia entomophila]CAI1789856.1 Na(+)-translocating NADH-quinone reductase subunit C [S